MSEVGEHDSLAPAAVQLMRSRRVREWLIRIALVVGPSAGTWIAAKTQTRQEIDKLTASVQALTAQQARLVVRIDELYAQPPAEHVGPLFVLKTEVEQASADALRAYAVALATEADRVRARKIDAAETLVAAYEKLIAKGKPASSASGDVRNNIAIR